MSRGSRLEQALVSILKGDVLPMLIFNVAAIN